MLIVGVLTVKIICTGVGYSPSRHTRHPTLLDSQVPYRLT